MSKFKGKKILIVGLGRSGVAVAKYMAKQGAKIMVTDIKQKTELMEYIKDIAHLKIEYDLGRHTNKYFHEADLIVLSPGVPNSVKALEEAREMGVAVTTEVDLAARSIDKPLIAVTGTNGKTTTSMLINKMFQCDQQKTFLGGNIGNPLLNYFTDEATADVVVVELSSFQIALSEKLVPAVAVFTNIGEDHLDRYSDMESYIQDKKKLLKACDRNTFVVLNFDDPVVAGFSDENHGKLLWFTKRNPMKIGGQFAEEFSGAYLSEDGKTIHSKIAGREEVYDLSHFCLFGEHNKENLMAAICAARVQGVKAKSIQDAIDTFSGVPHRLEFVRKKNGVYIFNDSKATNVMSVQKSLMAFKKSPIILIGGGRDKDMDFTLLADYVKNRVKILILIGEAKEKMNRAIGDYCETYLLGTFEEAVLLAYQKSRSGDIILLSPGCASYDMFRNFEERGDYFKKLVNQL